MMSADTSPLSVVTALRQSRKGKLTYDRHWTERNSSVERVLNEVTEKIENIAVVSEKKVLCDQKGRKNSEVNITSTSTPKSSLSKKCIGNRMRDSMTALSPLNLDKSKSSLTSSPVVLSPVFINMNRTEERDIVDPRNIVMSSESSINTSMSQSYLTEDDPLNSSSFSYETPNLIKYTKFPRVDVQKLRLPPTMFVGTDNSHDESSFNSSLHEPCRHPSDSASPNAAQSEVEDEIVKYELECREEAEKRVQERKAKWEQQSKEKEVELREELEKIKKQHLEEEQSMKSRTSLDLEKEIEQTIKIQLEEREERQKTLILQAKKEEQLAKEKQQRKIRIGQQMEKLAPLQTQISKNLTKLLELWSKQEDKKVYSDDLTTSVPKLIQSCNEVCEEARKKVIEGECGLEMFEKLNLLDGGIKTTAVKIEQELDKINAQRKEEEEKAEQQKLLLIRQEEEKKAAEERAKQEQLQQQQQALGQTPAIATAPVPTTTTTPAVSGVQTLDNKSWYDEILRFKTEFIKNVVFTDQEKQFKFDLQKAVNTPLNSLSGVSSAHLQDKVDKLVTLLSGAQVTVGERTITVNQHPHAKSFCMGLAAKKLAKQGEDVVTADHKLAFPAATLALALWDKFPDFGKLLLAYMFEMCPFLVPFHPQQTVGQSDREYYTLLGYKYEKDVVEPQDKYLKRMTGLGRLYAALSVSHLPRSSLTTNHPHPPARLWCWLTSVLNLSPHTDVTASLILDILKVSGHTMFASYGKQFGKLLEFIKSKYFNQLESVKSVGGPTVNLDQFLLTAIRGCSIGEPEGALKPGFL